MSDFLEYAKSLLVSGKGLIHDYRAGHLRDLSGNGAAVSDSSGAKWNRSKRGFALQCEDGGLTIPDQASLRVTDVGLSIVAFGDFSIGEVSISEIAEKRDSAAAYDWMFLVTSSSIRVYDTLNTESTLVVSWRTSNCLSFSCANGEAPEIYLDGLVAGTGGSVLSFSDNNRTVYIGERGYASTARCEFPLDALLIYPNKVLSDAEHAELYRLYRLGARVGPGPKRPKWFVKEDLTRSPVLHLASFDSPTDLSGNGNDGTKSGAVTRAGGVYGDALDFHGQGSGVVTVADDASIQDLTTKTICGWIYPRGAGGGGFGRIIEKGPWTVYLDSSGAFARIVVVHTWSGGEGSWYYNLLPAANRPYHVAISYDNTDPANDPVIYVNGLSVTVTEVSAPVGAPATDVGSDIVIGYSTVVAGREFDGWIDDVRIYDSILTPAQIRDIYIEGATKPRIFSPRYEHPVSLADESAHAGPWQIGSGTFQWTDDGDRRWLDCISSGWAAAASAQAFGGWYFRGEKASSSYVLGLHTRRAVYTSATNDGYILSLTSLNRLQFFEVTNGTPTVLISTATNYVSNSIEYEFFLARRPIDSQFSLYIRGGVYTSWTLVASVVDATNTTFDYFVADLDAGDMLADVIFFPFGGTIDPTEGDLDGLLGAT